MNVNYKSMINWERIYAKFSLDNTFKIMTVINKTIGLIFMLRSS